MLVDITIRFTVNVPDGYDLDNIYTQVNSIDFEGIDSEPIADQSDVVEYETISCVATYSPED